ncbi:uncharacterized protein SCHCODRAFT_01170395 [Schizophyllum commune H4-8]|uniref:Uncharacterized protein n=1 Tax=Schizophyllum commune (strain H4-8 / FGSC 9210) TaxID=578458 RepID=D8PZ34_SCHCM|nr:uncharacterized protein SCHCODRAFT_01170395 [Schizophyllum commune H4-8]KAI5896207.1 hypothetical protein SCHCODRAFT_01170395 [Schizophyllum commune H4-8]
MCFPALEHLTLAGMNMMAVASLMSHGSVPRRLFTLHVSALPRQSLPGEFSCLTRSIGNHCAHDMLTVITIERGELRCGNVLTKEDLVPLCGFPRLTQLSLRLSRRCNLDDADYAEVTSRWPEMETFEIGGLIVHDTEDGGEEALATMATLGHFARSCTKLKHLTLPLVVREIPRIEDDLLGTAHPLKTLEIEGSPTLAILDQIAMFLVQIFPDLPSVSFDGSIAGKLSCTRMEDTMDANWGRFVLRFLRKLVEYPAEMKNVDRGEASRSMRYQRHFLFGQSTRDLESLGRHRSNPVSVKSRVASLPSMCDNNRSTMQSNRRGKKRGPAALDLASLAADQLEGPGGSVKRARLGDHGWPAVHSTTDPQASASTIPQGATLPSAEQSDMSVDEHVAASGSSAPQPDTAFANSLKESTQRCLTVVAVLDSTRGPDLPAAIDAVEQRLADLRSHLNNLPAASPATGTGLHDALSSAISLIGMVDQKLLAAKNRVLQRMHVERERSRSTHLSSASDQPTRIDNRRHLTDPTENYHISSIIGSATTLAIHLYDGASRRTGNFLLRALPWFATAHTWLNTGACDARTANVMQKKALDDIPEDIRTVRKRFNLEVEPTVYAVCPKCGALSAPSGSYEHPSWHSTCSEPVLGTKRPCNEALLKRTLEGKTRPIKTLCHFPFSDWFGRFIALPRVEEYGDKFCADVCASDLPPLTKSSLADGDLVRSLPGPSLEEDTLFVADRGSEGRWVFMLEVDFFNVEGNKAGGASKSTGATAMVCLNLPLEMRYDDAYLYVPWILGGPKEPDSKEAQLRHPMRLVRFIDFIAERWQAFLQTSKQDIQLEDHWISLPTLYVHTAVFGIIQHLPTATGRTGTRSTIERCYGTRDSVFWDLGYWDVTRQLIVDPMHSVYLGVARRHFTVGLGLHDPKPGVARAKRSDNIAFHNPFPLLPPLSTLKFAGSSETGNDTKDALALEDRAELSEDQAAMRRSVAQFLRDGVDEQDRTRHEHSLAAKVAAIRSRLKQNSDSDANVIKSSMETRQWNALAYVCNDYCLLDEECQRGVLAGAKQKAVTREQMAQLLSTQVEKQIGEEETSGPSFNTRTSGVAHTDVDRLRAESLEKIASQMSHATAYSVGNIHRLLMKPLMAAGGDDPDNAHSSDPVPAAAPSDRSSSIGTDDERSLGRETSVDIQSFNGLDDDPTTPRAGSITPRAGSIDTTAYETLPDNAPPRSSDGTTPEALAFACWELGCHPGKEDKKSLVSALLEWRARQPLEGLPWSPVRSHEVLQRLHQCLRDVVRPTSIVRPPPNVGLPSAGKIKAAHFKTLYELFVPLCVLSLWKPGSPIAISDAETMDGPLTASMLLTCAIRAMVADVLTEDKRKQFISLYSRHVEAIERDCPGIATPNHHLSFHIYDFMSLLGPVRTWWCFPFERLLGRMQRMGINHIPGEYEQTLMETYYARAFFRQSLMQSSSPFVQAFRHMMEQLFDTEDGCDDDDDEDPADEGRDPVVIDAGDLDSQPQEVEPPLQTLSARLRDVPLPPVRTRQAAPNERISAVRIGRRIYSANHQENSYVTFVSQKSQMHSRWSAGKIIRMEKEDGRIIFYISLFTPLRADLTQDPFAAFWNDGFEAQSVSPVLEHEKLVDGARLSRGHRSKELSAQQSYTAFQCLWLRGWLAQVNAIGVEERAKESSGPASLFPPEVAIRGLGECDGEIPKATSVCFVAS